MLSNKVDASIEHYTGVDAVDTYMHIVIAQAPCLPWPLKCTVLQVQCRAESLKMLTKNEKYVKSDKTENHWKNKLNVKKKKLYRLPKSKFYELHENLKPSSFLFYYFASTPSNFRVLSLQREDC